MVIRLLALLALSSSGCSLLGLDRFDCAESGYRPDDDGMCQDIPECAEQPALCGRMLDGGEMNQCLELPGSYGCSCRDGFGPIDDAGNPGCAPLEPLLSMLVTNGGVLTPELDPETLAYEVSGPDTPLLVTLTPEVLFPTLMTITVDGVEVQSGQPSLAVVGNSPRQVVIEVTVDSSGRSNTYTVTIPPVDPFTYFKAEDVDLGDNFGWVIAMSDDGSTLAVGMRGDNSAATGIDGDHTDESATGSGAVYVFRRTAGAWAREAYVKASNTEADDFFGCSVALSGDGAVLAVGACNEASGARGVDGDETDNTAPEAGAVYVFERAGGTWAQEAYLKASNTASGDTFGNDVALSDDGTVLVVAAPGEDSDAVGVGGDETNDLLVDSGAAYVFRRGASWAQEAYVKSSAMNRVLGGDEFGASVALSADGATLAIGAPYDRWLVTGSGAVYLFRYAAGEWTPEASFTSSGADAGDEFGRAVALDASGSVVAVGANYEDSDAVGVGGTRNELAPGSGAVHIFRRSEGRWVEEAYLKASNTDAGDVFGGALCLSADGAILAVGAPREASTAMGLDGDQSLNFAAGSGAVYVFRYRAGEWAQVHYLKAPNTYDDSYFGGWLAMSGDASVLAVAAFGETSAATGVDGDPSLGFVIDAGAVFVY